MKLKKKGWMWYLTFPFAHNNFTYNPINRTIYHPKNREPSERIVVHESVHQKQADEVGRWKFIFLYLFAFPLFWNKYRFRWELEAYTVGSGITEIHAVRILRSAAYGWLRNGGSEL